jgi:hypothetical protein
MIQKAKTPYSACYKSHPLAGVPVGGLEGGLEDGSHRVFLYFMTTLLF